MKQGPCVIVTRPPRQAAPLCAALEAAGATVIPLPLIDIEACTPAQLPDVETADWFIFTSPNAVHHGLKLLGSIPDGARLAAIGAATAAALRAMGYQKLLVPEREYNSEGLLALPELQTLDGQQVIQIKGEGGRELIAKTLRQRGAHVVDLCAYRRTLLNPPVDRIEQALRAGDFAIITSGEILQRLHALCPDDCHDALRQLQLVVPSARVVQMAQSLGLHQVCQVPSPLTEAALVQAVMEAQSKTVSPEKTHMSEEPKDTSPAAAASTGRVRSLGYFILFALVVGIVAFSGALYVWKDANLDTQRVYERLDTLESRLNKLNNLYEQQAALLKAQDETASALTTLSDDLEQTARNYANLAGQVHGGRRHWQFTEIEQLMLIANDRLNLHNDINGALQALSIANQRIGRVAEPRLLKIRQALIDEIASLKAVPQIDLQAIVLQINGMIGSIDELPLSSNIPAAYEAKNAPTKETLAASGWERFAQRLLTAIQGMFTIRKENQSLVPLLSPAQEYFLRQNLELKLESARLAVMQRDSSSFRSAMDSAQSWLQAYYAQNDPNVKATQQAVSELRRVELRWDMPDISGSLGLMRDFLDQQQS